jgi:hypothetical protein
MKGRYWVDANIFIWGARDPYPMDGAMKYWNWFEKMVDAGKITTHKRVIKEILAGEKKGDPDPLIPWVKTRQLKLADQAPDSKHLQDLVGDLCQFSFTKFGAPKTIEFTKGADLFLIARAKLDDGAVVTQESEKKLVRVPTVCGEFGVKFMTIFQMNKELKMNLI